METYLDADPPKLPLTPHHTQVVAMLIFAQFYEQREACAARGVRAAILQMGTGEGKSIVIAMMAIYTVKHLGNKPKPKPKPSPNPSPNPNPASNPNPNPNPNPDPSPNPALNPDPTQTQP